MAQCSVHEAKTHPSRLIAEALEGGDVLIARGSIPVVRLVPIEPRGRRQFGALKGRISVDTRFDEPLPQDELDAWNCR